MARKWTWAVFWQQSGGSLGQLLSIPMEEPGQVELQAAGVTEYVRIAVVQQ